MSLTSEIIGYAATLFDVFGINKLPDGNTMFIAGLESTAERDLDEFGQVDGLFEMHGYRKHFVPKLESMIDLVEAKGFSAALIGRYGYPLKGEADLKEMVLTSGIGRRGKSTIVLHPEYGTRLRFAAISSDIPVECNEVISITDYDPCRDCTVCIDICPLHILEPNKLNDIPACLSNAAKMEHIEQHLVPCDICLQQCPA
jgi:epoxyqueuosine reductase QueG